MPAIATLALPLLVASAVALDPQQTPGGAPAIRPPPREKQTAPEKIFKPTKVPARTPEFPEDPAPDPGGPTPTPGEESMTTPAGPPAPGPRPGATAAGADAGSPGVTTATPGVSATPRLGAPSPPPPAPVPMTTDNVLLLLALAAVVLGPLVLAVWWITRGQRGGDGRRYSGSP
jgi:hypothetical protein